MKRILFIVPGGSGTIPAVTYNIYKTMLNSGKFCIFSANLNYREEDPYNFGKGLKFKYGADNNFISRVISHIKQVLEIKKFKKDNHIDITISCTPLTGAINVWTKQSDKTINIFHTLPHKANCGKLLYILNQLLYKFPLKKLDKKCAISTEMLRYLQNNGYSPCELAYNIHDYELIKSKSKEVLDNPKEIDFFSENNVALYVGQMDNLKAPERLIRAIAILRDEYNIIIKAAFVGKFRVDTHTKEKCLALIDKLNLSSQILFMGWQNNPYKYMSKSKYIVSTSKSEGLPGVLVEAKFLGIPIISTNSCMAVWEIMDCLDSYDATLDDFFSSKFGTISSNKNKDYSNFDSTIDDCNLVKSLKYVHDNYELYSHNSNHKHNIGVEWTDKYIMEQILR